MKKGNIIIKNAAQLVTCSGFSAKKGREMSNKTLKQYFVTAPNGAIQSIEHSRKEAREYRIPFQEKIVKVQLL